MLVCIASTVSIKRPFVLCEALLILGTGRIVRISPNEYSIDDPDAARIIYRTMDELVKVRKQADLYFL